jgi:hypothetical protein
MGGIPNNFFSDDFDDHRDRRRKSSDFDHPYINPSPDEHHVE